MNKVGFKWYFFYIAHIEQTFYVIKRNGFWNCSDSELVFAFHCIILSSKNKSPI